MVPESHFRQKTPEMNELEPYLSNACLNFKIDSVLAKLQPVKVGNKTEKSEDFMRLESSRLDFLVKTITLNHYESECFLKKVKKVF